MIDRYQLRYFLAVVDQGNFSRAAQHCHVSQPTLSVGIAKLERTLGVPLFLRTSQRVQLTSAGSQFLTHARRIESEFNLAAQVASGTAQQAVLRLGVLRSIPGAMLARAVRAALAEAPEAQVELVEGTEREVMGSVARGRVDCALTIVGRGSDRFHEEPLLEEGYALALPLAHRAAGLAEVNAEALGGDVMIVRRHCEMLSETSRHFTERGIRPHFSYRSINDERVLQLVASGAGVTVMPDSYSHPEVARVRLSGFAAHRTVGLVYGIEAEDLAASPPPLIAALRLTFRAASATLD